MEEILEKLSALLKIPNTKSKKVPAPLILAASFRRSGISKTRVIKKIIQRENEILDYDIPHHRFIEIVVEEIFDELLENAYMEIALPPTGIGVVTATTPTGELVVGTAKITNIQSGNGIIR